MLARSARKCSHILWPVLREPPGAQDLRECQLLDTFGWEDDKPYQEPHQKRPAAGMSIDQPCWHRCTG
jgi:hypothetical protein